jgi:hypothetical protein
VTPVVNGFAGDVTAVNAPVVLGNHLTFGGEDKLLSTIYMVMSNGSKWPMPVAADDRRPRFCRLCEIHDWPFLCAMDSAANRLLCAASKRLERKHLPSPTRASVTAPGVSGDRLAPHAG